MTGGQCASTFRNGASPRPDSKSKRNPWEASEAYELDRNPLVNAWVKNDHLGFEVLYVYRGVVRKYRPDFIIRLKTGNMLVLETKGQLTSRPKPSAEPWSNGLRPSISTAASGTG